MPMTLQSTHAPMRRLIPLVLAAFLAGLAAPTVEAVTRQRKGGLKQMMALGVKYFKRKRYISAFKVWKRVADALVKKRLYENPKKVPVVAKLHYLAGYALFKAKKYQFATRYWRRTLSLQENHPKALRGLKKLAKAGLIDAEEVSPDPSFPPDRVRKPADSDKPDDDKPDEDKPDDGGDEPGDEGKPPPVEEEPVNALAGIDVSPDRGKARAAWDEGKRMLQFGQAKVAISKFQEAFKFGQDKYEVDYQLGHAFLKDERAENAIYHFEQALESNQEDPRELHLGMGMAYSLQGDVNKEIASYERILQIDPDYGEAHFMLALAYDKVDNSPKVLEHAQKAIRIDPEYKEKLKPRIKDSNVSKKIGRIVSNVLKDSKYERLTDEKIEEYAEEIGRILGEENLNTEEFMGQGGGRRKLRSVLQDVRDGKDMKNALNEHIPKEHQKNIKKAFVKNKKLRSLASQLKNKYKKGR